MRFVLYATAVPEDLDNPWRAVRNACIGRYPYRLSDPQALRVEALTWLDAQTVGHHLSWERRTVYFGNAPRDSIVVSVTIPDSNAAMHFRLAYNAHPHVEGEFEASVAESRTYRNWRGRR